MTTTRAIVLAGGLGTRMRVADPEVHLTPGQRRAADAGLKAMVPVNGRPFLDYLLSALADAGLADVVLVVAPDHDAVRRYYDGAVPARVRLSFAVQLEPLGTANALLAAERCTGIDPFLVMNADNLYPVAALRELAALDEPGLLAFDPVDLVRTGNISAERIFAFAIVDLDAHGGLTRIVEKPTPTPAPGPGARAAGESWPATAASGMPAQGLVSMNCWRFDARIFDACRAVRRSARGEFELPEAVGLAVRDGVRFQALPARGPVLDLSRQADTADVARRLDGIVPRP